jgi:hypothetical protein
MQPRHLYANATAALNLAVTAFLVAIGPRSQAKPGKFARKERSL